MVCRKSLFSGKATPSNLRSGYGNPGVTAMKPYLSMILGISLLGSIIAQAPLPASANEIDWQEVPETRVIT